MLLQLKGNTNPRNQFHLPSDAANVFLATGLAEEIKPPAKPDAKPTKWVASVGGLEGAYPPVLKFSCPNCNQGGHVESARGTAHQTAKFIHCGRVETAPEQVAETYVALWKQYTDRMRRR